MVNFIYHWFACDPQGTYIRNEKRKSRAGWPSGVHHVLVLKGCGLTMPHVNPSILQWARETAGLTLDNAAEKLSIADARGVAGNERLAGYEAGEFEPSRSLLVRMAKQYRRPLLAFYMAQAPRTGDRGQDFRTLPPEHSRSQDALVDALVRDIRARQAMVRALLEDEDEAARLPFVGSMKMRDGAAAVLQSIVETLDLDLHRYRNGGNKDGNISGFAYLRYQAEQAGVFVLLIGNLGSHHTNLDVETFRGFALADDVAPFIVINDQDAETAWAFTLLHELCHIWLGQTGVSGANAGTGVEQFCNDLAGRFLLPTDELEALRDFADGEIGPLSAKINEFAEPRQVSRSMVVYKLYREGMITQMMWKSLNNAFRSQWLRLKEEKRERTREREGGPNYYVVRRHRLGDALVSLARRMLAESALSPTKAAKVLGVKPSNVYNLLSGDPGRAAAIAGG